jgi:hypothetical protein
MSSTKSPLNFKAMDVSAFVSAGMCLEVKTTDIHEISSPELHHEGLFSEQIFGEIGSSERLIKFGYISLNTNIIVPVMYDLLMSIDTIHKKIVSGETYAIFDNGKFIKSTEETPGADTGYMFFRKHVKDIRFEKSDNLNKDIDIKAFDRNKENILTRLLPVIPAGIRDINMRNGRDEYDDMNKIYMQLLNMSKAILNNGDDIMYEPVILGIQRKTQELYDYLYNIIEGKKGFMQDKYSSRGIVLGTRNVITAATTDGDAIDSDVILRSDEVAIPLFQVLNMFKPLIINKVKTIFTANILEGDSEQALVIDPKTMENKYIAVDLKAKTNLLSTEGIEKLITMFRDEEVMHRPFSIINNKVNYPLFIKYDNGEAIRLSRSISELKTTIEETGQEYDPGKVSFLTWFEMFYICAVAIMPKSSIITRFPVLSDNSVLTSKVHILTTEITKETKVGSGDTPEKEWHTYSRFPIKSKVMKAMSLHSSHLVLYDADHDGDTVTAIGILTNEGNSEVFNYLDSPKSIINPDGKSILSVSSGGLANRTLHCLTTIPSI